MKCDFSGWATRSNLKCSDGRTIRPGAFKDCDGKKVPLVWNHRHDEPFDVLGHAMLEDRRDGTYAYCTFNGTEAGHAAKIIVEHGDVVALSIYANQLKQNGGEVVHGNIREVSLVLAGANPGAYIDSVMVHGENSDEEAVFKFVSDEFPISHADNGSDDEKKEAKDDDGVSEKKSESDSSKDEDKETLKDVFETLTEKQKTAVYAMVGMISGDADQDNKNDSKEEDATMKHNIFDKDVQQTQSVLSHSDEQNIIQLAKSTSCGSLQDAIAIYVEQNEKDLLAHSAFESADDFLAHGFESIESLFPEYKDVRPGAPELLTRDYGWVGAVMDKVHKSPFSRIRTRQTDIRNKEMRALGYKTKGAQKKNLANAKLLKRTTDPQTVYVKDQLDRDDVIDIADFDVVNYQYGIMRGLLNEELAMAIMVGDRREDGDDDKIQADHIRPIWQDDDLYTIHADIDLETAKNTLQGTNTGANFGDNYVFAEAFIEAALYSREHYKGSGKPDLYIAPHSVNVMLLARDVNGRRIYNSVAELATALNVGNIYTAEQFAGLERTDSEQKKHKLHGLFVNLQDYSLGSVKGGEITRFNQFDIDFNKEKYLMETRVSGALTRVYSAVAIEEKVGE